MRSKPPGMPSRAIRIDWDILLPSTSNMWEGLGSKLQPLERNDISAATVTVSSADTILHVEDNDVCPSLFNTPIHCRF
jgi:hypothetical protein